MSFHAIFFPFLLAFIHVIWMDSAQYKVEYNILHIVDKKKNKRMYPEVKVIRVERRRARYMRKFSLADNSNLEDIKAS